MFLNSELEFINERCFKPCRLVVADVTLDEEAYEYGGHTILLHDLIVKFRVAKITPTKTGQFVTLWKRNSAGITEPYTIFDQLDACIIATRMENQVGVFIFSKTVMQEHGILSTKTKEGKRGFRVYPTWDVTTNKQAQKTQAWQIKYFVNLSDSHIVDASRILDLLK